MGRLGHASCACTVPDTDATASASTNPATCFIAFSILLREAEKQILCRNPFTTFGELANPCRWSICARCGEFAQRGQAPRNVNPDSGGRRCRVPAEPPPLEQPLGRRQAAAEGGVELGRVARAAGGIHVIAQLLRRAGV